MTPNEMLGVLDDVIAVAKRGRRRRHDLVIDLHGSPQVLGETGTPDDEPGVYWFTLRQCQRIRRRILKAARADRRRT